MNCTPFIITCTSSRAGTLIIAQLYSNLCQPRAGKQEVYSYILYIIIIVIIFSVPAAQDSPSELPLTVKAEVKAPPSQPVVKEPVGQVSWISEVIITDLAQSKSGEPDTRAKIFEGQT